MTFIVLGDDVYIPYQPSPTSLMYKRYRLDAIISQEEMKVKLFGSSTLSNNVPNNRILLQDQTTNTSENIPKKRKKVGTNETNNSKESIYDFLI